MHTLIATGFSSSTYDLNFPLFAKLIQMYSLCRQSLSLQARIVDMLKKSTYFSGLPDLVVSCPELDGTADSTPIIFEERYVPLASSTRASRLPSSDTPDAPPIKNRRSSAGRFSPEKVARALKSSLCLDLRHMNKPASAADDDVYLVASKAGDDCESCIQESTQTAAPDDVGLLAIESGRCASASPTLSDASSVPPPIHSSDKRNVSQYRSNRALFIPNRAHIVCFGKRSVYMSVSVSIFCYRYWASVVDCSASDGAKFSIGART